METLLKATELEHLLDLSERHIRRMTNDGKLIYKKKVDEKNRPLLLFPLDALSPDCSANIWRR